jgi:phage shock protein PspC (stress-responsive transcriptional regulator)
MADNDLKQCPYCAEFIRKEAVKCRFCGSMLTNASEPSNHSAKTRHWNRSASDKRIAGVCGGIAHEFNAPHMVLPLRLFFLLTIFFGGFGLLLYVILWILMPAEPKTGAFNSAPYTAPQSAETAPSQQQNAAPTNRRHTTAVLVVLALVCITALVLFSHTYQLRPMFLPHINLPHPIIPHAYWPFNNWNNSLTIGDFGGFPHWFRFPFAAGLAILVLTILLFGIFHMFRVALGCLGVLIGIIALLIIVPVMIPMVVVPVALLIPLILFFGFIALIIMALKALLG